MHTLIQKQVVLDKLYNYKIIKQTVENIEDNTISGIDNSLYCYLKNNDNTFENSIIKLLDDTTFQNNKKWLDAFKELNININDKPLHQDVLNYAYINNNLKRSDKCILYKMLKDKKKINKTIYYQIKRNLILELLNIAKKKGLIYEHE